MTIDKLKKLAKNVQMNSEIVDSSEDESWVPDVFGEEDEDEKKALSKAKDDLAELNQSLEIDDSKAKVIAELEKKISVIEKMRALRKGRNHFMFMHLKNVS